MEGDTKALATAGEEPTPAPLDAVAYDERDIAVIRATQGDMPVVRRALRAGRGRRSGWPSGELLEHMAGMRERGLLRRVAAILYHRRAGFSANGMGVWKVARAESRSSARGWPPSAASRTATSARPTRTGRTRSSRWPTAARRRSATPCSTRSPSDTGIEERATLYSSTEFKKVRLLYFTDEYRAGRPRTG